MNPSVAATLCFRDENLIGRESPEFRDAIASRAGEPARRISRPTRTVYAITWREGARLPAGIHANAREFGRRLALTAMSHFNRAVGGRFLGPLYRHQVFDDQLEEFERLIVELERLGSSTRIHRHLNRAATPAPIWLCDSATATSPRASSPCHALA